MSRLEAFMFKFGSVLNVKKAVRIEVFICQICLGALMLGASTLLLVAEYDDQRTRYCNLVFKTTIDSVIRAYTHKLEPR